MKSVFTILVALLVSATSFAASNNTKKAEKDNATKTEASQAIVRVMGSIIDQKSNETLAGAAVYVDGKKVYTDLDGNFVLTSITPGVHKIKVELISYQTVEQDIDIRNNKPICIHLIQK